MKKILFITNRNILTACGELRLIKNRTEMLYKSGNIITDFIVINHNNRFKSEKREHIEKVGKIIECGYRSKIFIIPSIIQAKKEMIKMLNSDKYAEVIISGTMVYKFAKVIRKKYKDINILLDIHGASEDMLEIAASTKGIRKIALKALYRYEIKYLGKAVEHCDGFLVVTDELKNYLVQKYPNAREKVFYRIPCACKQLVLNEKTYKTYRKKYRKKYGITNQLVFIYSGGVSNWQCIEETISLYKQLDKMLNVKTKMLIFSYNIEAIKTLVGDDQRFCLDSYGSEELSCALCAGDIALLLRKKSLTNQVAFPNKFLEYVAGGMKIITTPYVKEVAKQVKKFNVGYIYDFCFDSSIVEYVKRARGIYDEDLIKSVLKYNSYELCLKELIADIERIN